MSLFDSASLVVTPNGVKEDKLYSIKPTDGSGDLVVTRATTATRVNSDGLIEQVPYNLLTYSEQFDNGAWTKTNVTISANSTESPDGNLTADTLTKSSTGVDGSVVRTVTATATGYVGSIFVKKDTNTSRFPEFFLRSSDASGENEIYVQLNTSTGATAIRLQFGTVSVSAPVLINGYWRLSFYALANSNTCRFGIRPAAGTTLGVYNANATGSIIAWGAQLVSGTSAKEYFPTTDRLDVPRLDYTNSSCPSILVEPQRTNVALRSEEFDNGYWEKYRCDLSANSQISPSGIQNADTFTSSVGQSFVPAIATTNITFLGNTRYSFSIYVKKIGTTDSFVLGYVDNSTGYTGGKASYNLTTQSITITQSPNSSVTASMQSVGNGWYRLVLNFLTIATPTYNYIELNIPSKTTTNTFAIWGAQLEQGSYATSYIPTIASSVTRNADVISKTGISSLIGQTEGTLFWDINVDIISGADSENIINIDNGFFGTTLYLIKTSVGTLGGELYNGGVVQFSATTPITQKGRYKCALAYKTNDFALYINGVQIAIDSSGTVGAMSRLQLGQGVLGASVGNTNLAILWKERLSDAELELLTGNNFITYNEMATYLNYNIQ